jgi:hypothetical protein
MLSAVLRVSLAAAATAGLWIAGPAFVPSAAAAPHVAVSPDSIAVTIASGDSSQSTVTISNSGDADLHFTLRADYNVVNVARAPRRLPGFAAVPTPGVRSNVAQPNRPIPVSRSVSAGARILLLEDALPWGYDADERVLAAYSLTYDRATSTDLPFMDLSAYRLVIVAADQSQTFYGVIQAQAAKLENFVVSGGSPTRIACCCRSIRPSPACPPSSTARTRVTPRSATCRAAPRRSPRVNSATPRWSNMGMAPGS